VISAKKGDTTEGKGRPLFGTTDGQGKFRIEGVLPGVKYDLWTAEKPGLLNSLARGIQVEPGEEKDLGDVPAMPAK